VSLRARVLAGIAVVGVVLVLVLVAITRTTEDKLLRQVDQQLADALGSGRRFDLPFGGPVPPVGDDPRRLTSFYVAWVRDGDVQTLLVPNVGDDEPLPLIDADEAVAAARSGRPFTVGSDQGDLRFRARATSAGRFDGVLVVALPLRSVDDAVAGLVRVEVIGAAVIVATLALVAWWVVHLGIRPVQRMTTVAGDIAAGDLSRRVPAADPRTEAGALGQALNQMLGRIEEAFDERRRAEQRLRQFVADASHELRTPVATIRGYAELYRAGGLRQPGELDDALRRTEQEAVRMGGLVDDLLHLARLDEGRPLAVGPVDLAALVDDAARDARAQDPARPVTVRADGPLVVAGDEARLRQVLANVVGNALVHTLPGTPVEITAARRDGRAVVEVTDHGPGMSAEVAARAFERFYRADPARSRHRGGSGLGLAIVDATVRAHGGAAAVASTPGVGTTLRIELPLDGPVPPPPPTSSPTAPPVSPPVSPPPPPPAPPPAPRPSA